MRTPEQMAAALAKIEPQLAAGNYGSFVDIPHSQDAETRYARMDPSKVLVLPNEGPIVGHFPLARHAVSFPVYGRPAGQGSKRHVGKGIMVESSKHLKPWRTDVREAAMKATGDDWVLLTGPVLVSVIFYRERPKSHFRTGRNAHLLREQAPRTWDKAKPDSDKLARGILDALSSVVYVDDAQVAQLHVSKCWAGGEHRPGAEIVVAELTP